MRAFVSSTLEPMKPESRPSSEQGLASAVNLAGAFDHEFTQTRHPGPEHASFGGSLVAEGSSLSISSVCLITLDVKQPATNTAQEALSLTSIGNKGPMSLSPSDP